MSRFLTGFEKKQQHNNADTAPAPKKSRNANGGPDGVSLNDWQAYIRAFDYGGLQSAMGKMPGEKPATKQSRFPGGGTVKAGSLTGRNKNGFKSTFFDPKKMQMRGFDDRTTEGQKKRNRQQAFSFG